MRPSRLPLRRLKTSLSQSTKPSSSCPRSRSISTSVPSLSSQRATLTRPLRISNLGKRAYSTSLPAPWPLFGQPVHETHPHILKPGELTPGITAQEYHERRAALCASLPANSAVILRSSEIQYRSGAVFHAFRQESNFFYLTGFSEPESLAVIQKTGDDPGDYIFHLLCRPKDPTSEQWNGPWSGIDAARDIWNADEAGDIGRAVALLSEPLHGVNRIFTDAECTKNGVETPFGGMMRLAAPHISSFSPLKPYINDLRAIKSPAEIANMRYAGQQSGRAITAAMGRNWKTEKELASFLDYTFQSAGLDGHAYIPVVAGGSRGLLIHYTLNNALVEPDKFILLDAGGEYGTYITDITRTWPASGKFTPAQKDLYNAVLKAQRSSVSLCRASANVTLDQLHSITERAMREELTQLGFETGGNTMDILFPHHVGHYVGLDVHDVPGYPRHVKLRKGHCITIEPGIYVPDDERFPKHFRGLGVRIEDSIAIGEDSPLNLTVEAVKEVDDIEALRS